MEITETLQQNADELAVALESRFNFHVESKVDRRLQNHWTIRFTHDNKPAVTAAMCIVGHTVADVGKWWDDERLLALQMEHMFQIIECLLNGLEGCYLCYNKHKSKWIRSGETLGEGVDA